MTSLASEWSPPETARPLLRTARSGALGTLDKATGFPYASLVGVATAPCGSPLLLLSRLARHTANLESDSRASVLIGPSTKGDPLAEPRITVLGRLSRSEDAALKARYLARHPEAALYIEFADFSIFRMDVEAAHLVAGFGRIVDLGPVDLLTDLEGADELLRAEARIAAHMNEDHLDAVGLYATRLLGEEAGAWRFVGCDPEGIEIADGANVRRLAFGRRVTTAGDLRGELVDLVGRARALE